MDPDRKRAVKFGLEEIDRNRGTYDSVEKQQTMLARIIETEQLKDRPVANGRALIDLTVERFREILERTVSNEKRNKGVSQPVRKLWTLGSELVDMAYLRKVDFEEQAIRAQAAVAPENSTSLGQGTKRHQAETSGSAQTPLREPPEETTSSPLTPLIESENEESSREPLRKKARTSGEGLAADDPVSQKRNLNRRIEPRDKVIGDGPDEKRLKKSPAWPIASTPEIGDASVEEALRVAADGSATHDSRPNPLVGTPGEAKRPDREPTGAHGEPAAIPRSIPPTPAPRMSVLGQSLIFLAQDDIRKELYHIWLAIEDIARNVFEGLPNGKAIWPSSPQDELRKLYERLFTEDYKGRLLDIDSAAVKCQEVVEACLAVAIFELVYNKLPPWEGPAEKFVGDKDAEVLERVLQAVGLGRSFEWAVWQTAKVKLDKGVDDNFLRGELQQIAADLEKSILLILAPQLDILGASGRGSQLMGELTRTVHKALVLRGQLRAAPHYYQLLWIRSGEEFDPLTMEEVDKNAGRREILWCKTPLVRVRDTVDSAWEVAVEAKVFARPWPPTRQ
ncbi:hypothetical protein LTR27_001562 [Elasticomyces elasticus]|nr:hypothetical protein LTR27_001562 [Elasticomyces elasticus]